MRYNEIENYPEDVQWTICKPLQITYREQCVQVQYSNRTSCNLFLCFCDFISFHTVLKSRAVHLHMHGWKNDFTCSSAMKQYKTNINNKHFYYIAPLKTGFRKCFDERKIILHNKHSTVKSVAKYNIKNIFLNVSVIFIVDYFLIYKIKVVWSIKCQNMKAVCWS